MYSLDCTYYTKSFSSIDELIQDIIISGMDPNYEITFNSKGTGELAFDLISEWSLLITEYKAFGPFFVG